VANVKISELTQLTNPVSSDVLPIVDSAVNTTKKISIADLLKNASAGSAAAPGIAFDDDSNTGIYSPGADQVAISTGGSGRLFINSDGTISVGAVVTGNGGVVVFNASGQTTANLSTSINNGSFIVARHNDASGGAGGAFVVGAQGGSFAAIKGLLTDGSNNTAGDLAFSTRATSAASTLSERLRITSAGLVGVGTSSPGGRLDVQGGDVYLGKTAQGDIFFSDGNDTYVKGANNIFLQTPNGSNRITVKGNTGNVGIGTTSPSAIVHSTVSSAGVVFRGSHNNSGIDLYANDATGEARITATRLGGSGGKFLSFYTDTGTGEFERARIDSSGRLLIGQSGAAQYNTFSPDLSVQISRGANLNANIQIGSFRSDQFGGGLILSKSRSSTVGTNTIVQNGDVLGSVSFNGADGTNWLDGGSINCRVDAVPGTGSMPTRLDFSTRTAAGSASVVRSSISRDGTTTLSAAASTAPFIANIDASEVVRIDSSGRLLVGTSSARSSIGSRIQLEGAGGGAAEELSLVYNGENTVGPRIDLVKTRGAAVGANTAVINNDELGLIRFYGADGTSITTNNGASIGAYVDGEPFTSGDTTDLPTRLVFSTTADGASSPTERMRITNGGSLLTFNSTNDSHEIRTALAAGTTNNLILGAYGATNNTGGGTAAIAVRTNGNIENANNSYAAFSDAKLKENIVDATSQWNDVKALQVRKYNFKEGQTHTQIGLVAQEVELVSPGLVTESPDRDAEGNDLGTTTKSVNYSVLYMKAVKALQEAMERIEQLETEMAAVKAQLA